MTRLFLINFLLITILYTASPNTTADALRAVDAVSSYLVRIETVGGHEKVSQELANTGTSTGILLDNEGFIITAAFHFLHDPASIIVTFPDGTKKVARKISTDRLRMITLLKTESLETLAVPKLPYRRKESVRIGEPCIAVGKVFSNNPNITRGVISGKNRIWGKAFQTDAAIGPNNYGGLLIDLDGNVLGIPVPLSMTSHNITAGAEMYDAGVGLAVPWEDMKNLIVTLKKGEDLMPGSFGFTFKDNQIFTGQPILAGVLSGSPAAQSGMLSGDHIESIDGIAMPTALEVMYYIRQRYVGETVSIIFLRNGNKETIAITAN